ncbi:MAG: cell division protein ZapA [Candidatus Poribacteria bacterium]|nr:cell division protein ZapA [Candidatus Poribacteria bacterium]MDE0503761.1 cell division protein ZapA [Candidatus Poribacteria bacterium]
MDSEELDAVKVDIFNNQYLIKPTDNLTEDDIRTLASYVDKLMRQVSRKGYDQLSVAILVALNLAEQMYKERKNSSDFLQGLIQGIDKVVELEEDPSNGEAV